MQTIETKEKEIPTWQISIMKQAKEVSCYCCDTTILKSLYYYGSSLHYVDEKYGIMLMSGQKLILEFLDRSNLEFEKGWLLSLGYGPSKSIEGSNSLCVLEQTSKSEIKEKYNLEPHKGTIPDVPDFYVQCNFFDNWEPHFDYKGINNKYEFEDYVKYMVSKGVTYKELVINKNKFELETEDSDRGLRRTYTYRCPKNSIIIINKKDINNGIEGVYIG